MMKWLRPTSLAFLAASMAALIACSTAERDDHTPDRQQTSQAPVVFEIESAELDQADDRAAGSRIAKRPAHPEARYRMEQESPAMAKHLGHHPIAPPQPDYTPLDSRENYQLPEDNPVRLVAEHPVSTFSIDVDTGSYTNVRRMLRTGHLPPRDAVRVEEFINYFDYGYAAPERGGHPFATHAQLAPAPWNEDLHLLQVGLQAVQSSASERPKANLVFLIDVSGSMNSPNKLPLLQRSLQMLARQMKPDDTIALAVYAGAAGAVLEPTPASELATIERAIANLSAGGSTAGAAGLELAYQMARENLRTNGINRVILASDGDFNVGISDTDKLIEVIEQQRKSGIALTTLGFGAGNLNDHMMERLADVGDGNYFYIDSLLEARKVLVQQMGSTLETVARDVKIQIEFNPHTVREYRLIGYQNRQLAREDFNNDKVDAGDIGAGHNVTALYEIALAGSDNPRLRPLRYGDAPADLQDSTVDNNQGDEFAMLALRYKPVDSDRSVLLERPITRAQMRRSMAQADEDLRFATAIAAFAENLRGGEHLGSFDLAAAASLARAARGTDTHGYRAEAIALMDTAHLMQQNLAVR